MPEVVLQNVFKIGLPASLFGEENSVSLPSNITISTLPMTQKMEANKQRIWETLNLLTDAIADSSTDTKVEGSNLFFFAFFSSSQANISTLIISIMPL